MIMTLKKKDPKKYLDFDLRETIRDTLKMNNVKPNSRLVEDIYELVLVATVDANFEAIQDMIAEMAQKVLNGVHE